MLGTLDGKGISDGSDPVERQSPKVQCVVALYPNLCVWPEATMDRILPGHTQKMDWPAMTLEWFNSHL